VGAWWRCSEVLGGHWCIMVAVQGACGVTDLIRWCTMVEKVYIKHGGSDGKVTVRLWGAANVMEVLKVSRQYGGAHVAPFEG